MKPTRLLSILTAIFFIATNANSQGNALAVVYKEKPAPSKNISSSTAGTITSLRVNEDKGFMVVSWTIDESKTPQLWTKVEVLDTQNRVVVYEQDVLSERRVVALNHYLPQGDYTIRLIMVDEQDQTAKIASTSLSIGAAPKQAATSTPSAISVHQDPTKAALTIQGPNLKTVRIVSIAGEILCQDPIENNHQVVDVSLFPEGHYLVVVTTNDEKIYTKEIEVEKQ